MNTSSTGPAAAGAGPTFAWRRWARGAVAVAVATLAACSADAPAPAARPRWLASLDPSLVVAQADTTSWVRLAAERQAFSLPSTQTVRYGTGLRWVQRELPAGRYTCSNVLFSADPAYGQAKECQALATSSAPASGSNCGLDGFAQELLDRANQFRSAPRSCGARSFSAAPPLRWNASLTQAATTHAADMAQRGFLSHTGSDGRTLVDRVNATGYAWSSVAENVAAGQTSVASVMSSWQGSEGHCANLMNPALQDLGAACALQPAGASGYGRYWALVLARPR